MTKQTVAFRKFTNAPKNAFLAFAILPVRLFASNSSRITERLDFSKPHCNWTHVTLLHRMEFKSKHFV